MNMIYVLYNPLCGDRNGAEKAKELTKLYKDKELEFIDITKIDDYRKLTDSLENDDSLIICGGDGTLNRFINDTYELNIKNSILYYAMGNGNDFLREIGKEVGCAPFRINDYIKDLPTVTVNEKTYHFLNGIGFGIDSYCCEVGDMLREKNKKPNYTAIAIKGLLYGYKPSGATVTVDGETRRYKKAWIAPTMYGKYYGGGMMPAPEQARNNCERKVSFAAIHGAGKLHTLCVFPSIFTGKHVTHTKMVDVRSGHDITVEFDRPAALQIDGETILNVKKYRVCSAVSKEKKLEEGVTAAV